MKHLYVGTSGYSYGHWKNGVFYPPGLAQSAWFEYYMQHFDTVELNITFYRLPSVSMVKNWYKRATPGFRFVIKGSRLITHNKKMNEPKEALRVFFKTMKHLKEKLRIVLWQFPPRFKKNEERLEGFLKALKPYRGYRHCFEFRDPSWFAPEIADHLTRFGAAYCRADRRDWYEGLEIPDTADFIYLRRHGPDAEKNYQLSYPPEALEQDALEMKRWAFQGKEVYIFFNNDIGGAAIRDAKMVQEYLNERKRMAA